MENKAHALAAGAFVLVAAALLLALAVWLTRDSGARRVYEVSTRDAVTGLQPQATVRFRGVNVGKVASIGFDRQVPGNVLLRLAVDEDTPVTRSTFASLGFQGVTGIAFVQLDDSGESKELLVSSDEQLARIPMRPGLVSQLSDQSTRILTQLEETSRRINLLLAPDNQKTLMTAIGSLGQAASGISQLAGATDQAQGSAAGAEPVNIPQLLQEAGVTLKSIQQTSASVAGSADEVKKSAGEFSQMAQRLNQPGGALDQLTEGAAALAATGQALNAATLPRLNRAADETARTVRQVGRAASTVSDNPQALIFGNGPVAPGPGEPGFSAPGGKP